MKSGWSVLSALVEDAADGHLNRGVLRELIDTLHDTRDPEALTLLAFARALARRDQALHDHANLYLRQLAVPQIELFQMLGAALPPVVDASRLVRDQLRFALEGAEAVTLVSIGCGTGQREAELLSGLGARRWHVFLVEPNADCLEQATRAVHDAADRAGASLALASPDDPPPAPTREDLEAILPVLLVERVLRARGRGFRLRAASDPLRAAWREVRSLAPALEALLDGGPVVFRDAPSRLPGEAELLEATRALSDRLHARYPAGGAA